MLQLSSHEVNISENDPYATAEDFQQLFAKRETELFGLSLHMTADAEKAKSCLILAERDCLFRSRVSTERMHTWARRMVIRNAIRLAWGMPNEILIESGIEFHLQPSEYPVRALRESDAILNLPDLDRLAFVICVLERYSVLDCALLLGKTPQKVHEAILRAIDQIVSIEEREKHQGAATTSGSACGAFQDGRQYFESSCGSIRDYDCR